MSLPPIDLEARSLAASIVIAFASKNNLCAEDLPQLIASVYRVLAHANAQVVNVKVVPPTRLVSINESITPDYLISMEDGSHRRSLKRHLATLGLSPAEYRSKWQLPNDYPMVAPSYSKKRSDLAKSFGLGRLRKPAKEKSENSVV